MKSCLHQRSMLGDGSNSIDDEEKREKAKKDLDEIRTGALHLINKQKDIALSEILDQLRYRIATLLPDIGSRPCKGSNWLNV